MGLRVTSENNFATASGLASSSSGLSCLAFALAQLYGLEEMF
jgi:mevalonate pyrophosphate decarboxylase